MKMSGGPGTRNIKIILLAMALIIAFGTVFYTRMIVEKLQQKEKQIVELYAKSLEYLANTEDTSTNLTFIFENVIKPIDFPIILTDTQDKINLKNKSGFRNLILDSTKTPAEQEEFLYKKIKEMDAINPPIVIKYNDSIIFGKIHYGDSDLINQLRNYPFLQILFAAMFILIGYISFSYIKRNEQSNIWVGMAKETPTSLAPPFQASWGGARS